MTPIRPTPSSPVKTDIAKTGTEKVKVSPTAAPKTAQQTVITEQQNIFSALKLPPDGLSKSIVAFARFFSLPLEPKLLANIRQAVLRAGLGFKPGVASPAAGAGREAAALAATAAADKGLLLGDKALAEYAAAIEGSLNSFTRKEDTPIQGQHNQEEAPHNSDGGGQEQGAGQEGNGQGRSPEHQNQDRSPEQQGTKSTIKNDIKSNLPKVIAQTLKERPHLDLINRIPGKNGCWIVIPFAYEQDGFALSVSLRIFNPSIAAKNVLPERLCADIKVTRLKVNRFNRGERRYLITLEKIGDDPLLRVQLCVLSGSKPCELSLGEQKRIKRELADALGCSPDRVTIGQDIQTLFADASDYGLMSVNEAV